MSDFKINTDEAIFALMNTRSLVLNVCMVILML